MTDGVDVSDPQVIIEYPDDDEGFYWHHRILIRRVAGPRWVGLTPDFDLENIDLSTRNHKIVERGGAFPQAQRPYVYAFDPVSQARVDSFKRSAALMATVWGDSLDAVMGERSIWLRADPSDPKFGEEVADELLTDAATGVNLESKGVVVLAGDLVFVERVPETDKEEWLRKKRPGGDARLLGDHFDRAGARHLPLPEAVALMREVELPGFPLAGPRGFKELNASVAQAGFSWTQYHAEWVAKSGVADGAAVAHTHRNLAETFRLMHHYDQIDGSSLAVGEQLARWMIQTETAVERNPRFPDYSGLDVLVGAPVSSDGRAETKRISEWVSKRMEQRSQIWKHERLYREEQKHNGPPRDRDGDGGGGGGRRGGGKNNKNDDGKRGGQPPPAVAK